MTTQNISLEHALIPIRDYEATMDYYRALFPDWILRWQGGGYGDGRWVHFGPPGEEVTYLSLWENRSATQVSDDNGLRIQHLGFRHPDVRGLVTRLADKGIRPSEMLEEGGYLRAYFVDPCGHELEFVEKR